MQHELTNANAKTRSEIPPKLHSDPGFRQTPVSGTDECECENALGNSSEIAL